MGLIGREAMSKESDFMNPRQVEERRKALEEAELAERMILLDEAKNQKYKRDMFKGEDPERTEHKGILPANIRIKHYKVKQFKKPMPPPTLHESRPTESKSEALLKPPQTIRRRKDQQPLPFPTCKRLPPLFKASMKGPRMLLALLRPFQYQDSQNLRKTRRQC